MPVIYQKIIKREDLRANPRVLYLFGDNDQRTGLGGQAEEMRGEPNAVGIRVKYRPARDEGAYWTDATLAENKRKIGDDFFRVMKHSNSSGIVVVPLDGIGTGRSELKERAPQTFAYLRSRFLILRK